MAGIQFWGMVAMALLSIGFTLLRLRHLDADFPVELDWSADLYSDEGWYANAAVRHAIGLPWFSPGDFNPAVNMPLGQLLHSLFFSLFGLNLFAARLPDVCAFALTVACTVAIVRSHFGAVTAWLAALMLAVNFDGFAFSRIAFMETIGMAFVATAMLLALKAGAGRGLGWLIAASIAAALACLVKTSMLFGLPVLACIAWHGKATWRMRLLRLGAAMLPAVALLYAWQIAAKYWYEADYLYFIELNVRDRLVTGVGLWLQDLPVQLANVLNLGDSFVYASLLLVAGAMLLSAEFRRSVVVHGLAVWLIGYFLMVSTLQYGPPRYFVPLLFPLSLLSAIACRAWMSWFVSHGAPHRAAYPALLLAVVAFFECKAVLQEMAHPQYSLERMAQDAGQIILAREGHLNGVTVFGPPADTLALVTGVRAVNTDLGTATLDVRLQRSRPAYVFSLGRDQALLDQLRKANAGLTYIKAWDVYGNYLFNSPRLELWTVDWHAGAAGTDKDAK